jgi:hypothetical protein
VKKSFLAGSILLGIVVLLSLIQNDWDLIYKVSGTFGFISLLISGCFLGAFISGDQLRANYNTEDKKEG